jgi:hypothetical protein
LLSLYECQAEPDCQQGNIYVLLLVEEKRTRVIYQITQLLSAAPKEQRKRYNGVL